MSQKTETMHVLKTYLMPGQAFSIHELMQALNAERTPIPKPNLYALLSQLKGEGYIAKKDKETYIYLGENGVTAGDSVDVKEQSGSDSTPVAAGPFFSDTLLFDGTQKVRTYEDGRVFVGWLSPVEQDSFFETTDEGVWRFDLQITLTATPTE